MSKNRLVLLKMRVGLLVLYLIPLTLLLWFVATFSVNEPFWDQLEFPFIFQKVAAGNANFADFFAQHNEHRILFPRLIVTALAFASKWNINYELYLNIGLGVITFLAFYKISANQINIAGRGVTHLANLLTGVLVFSLVQWENWLWGFEIAWFLINACVAVSILIFYSCQQWLPRTKLLLAATFCFIASFSAAHGFLSWLAMFPLVAFLPGNTQQKIKRILIWLLLLIAATGIYLIGYQKPEAQADIFFLFKKPAIAFGYFLSLLGSPLVEGINPFVFLDIPPFSNLYSEYQPREGEQFFAQFIGFLFGINFLFFIIILLKFHQKYKLVIQELIPWFCLGLFSFLFACLNTIGRSGAGYLVALQSRYTTATILLIIALLQIWKLFLGFNPPHKRFLGKQIYRAIAGVLLSLIVLTSIKSVATAKPFQLQRENGKICMELMRFMDERAPDSCLPLVYPDVTGVKDRLRILSRIGFRYFPRNVAFITQPTQDYGRIDVPPTIETPLILRQNESVKASGWAILPEQLEQPKMVLLSYGDKKTFFTTAPVHLASPDVAKVLNSSRYNRVRWAVNFSAKSLPLGETAIKAWVYDAASQKFFKLFGEPRVLIK